MSKITLSKEQWEETAQRILMVGELVSDQLRAINKDDKGENDVDELMTDIQIAVTAMNYVANFATDKCVFVRGGAE